MVQVFFVMLFFPVIMNALQYYIIDGFIKDQKPDGHEPIPSDDSEDDAGSDSRPRRRRSRGGRPEDDSGDEETIKSGKTVKATEVSDKADPPDRTSTLKANSNKLDEYDPATDGDRESSSGSNERRRGGNTAPPHDIDADDGKT